MIKSKAIIATIVIFMLILTACGDGGEAPADGGRPVSDAAVGRALDIAIVTTPSNVNDSSYNRSNYSGILNFISNSPDSNVSAIVETHEDLAMERVESIVDDYDVLVLPGYAFNRALNLAKEHPERYFIFIDLFPTDANGAFEEVDNIYAMKFAEQEGGFLAGIAAALETNTGKVAVVNGRGEPSNIHYQTGFACGVEYANRKLGAAASLVELPEWAGTSLTGENLGGNYIGSYDDPASGQILGNTLLSYGVDIIFVAAGDSGNGVFEAVKRYRKAYVIGCDSDQWDDGFSGSRNIILMSTKKAMGENIAQQLYAIRNGTFEGKNIILGADTESTGYITGGHQQLKSRTLGILAEIYEDVKSGNIIPASGENGYSIDNFPGLY